jgi:hypothetical protein
MFSLTLALKQEAVSSPELYGAMSRIYKGYELPENLIIISR